MIYVKVPKEIKTYETHLALGLTAKQWLYLCGSFLFSIILAAICYLFISESLISYIVIFFTIPGIAFGFIKPMDLAFDVYIRYVINFYRRKQKLIYDNELFIYKEKGGSTIDEPEKHKSIKEKWSQNRAIKRRNKEQKALKETYLPERIKD